MIEAFFWQIQNGAFMSFNTLKLICSALIHLSAIKSHLFLFLAANYDGNRFITSQGGVWKVSNISVSYIQHTEHIIV